MILLLLLPEFGAFYPESGAFKGLPSVKRGILSLNPCFLASFPESGVFHPEFGAAPESGVFYPVFGVLAS